MDIAEFALDIVTGLLLVIVGVLYTFFPQWSCKIFAPEQRARMRKLLRSFFGPVLLVLGLALLALQFRG